MQQDLPLIKQTGDNLQWFNTTELHNINWEINKKHYYQTNSWNTFDLIW